MVFNNIFNYDMKFILITRYNIPVNFGAPSVDPLDKSWLAHRKILFLSFCLPSVVGQTDENFDWYLGFHPKTTIDFSDQLPQNANIILSGGGNDFLDQIRDKYLANEFIASARLDNDDSLAKDFVEKTKSFGKFYQKNHESLGDRYALNWRTGCERDIRQRTLYKRDFAASSFVCLFEKKELGSRPLTVNNFHHVHISKDVPVANLPTTNPMWMINIHDRNVGNVLKGTEVLEMSNSITDRFSMPKSD
jgi:hypothetical protein